MTKRNKKMDIAIVRLGTVNPIDAIADVIVSTAAVYAYEHFDEFAAWVEKEMQKTEGEPEEITKEMLAQSISRIIKRSPEEI